MTTNPIAATTRSSEIPELDGLMRPTGVIHSALCVLEELFFSSDKPADEESWLETNYICEENPEEIRDELIRLIRSPGWSRFLNQSVAFWRLLDQKDHRIILFCRQRSPVASVLSQICRGTRLSEDFLNGHIRETDFPFLMEASGRLSKASVRICDAREPDAFMRVLFEAYPHFDCAMCDWDLTAEEIYAVYRMTRDSPIAFLCPQ